MAKSSTSYACQSCGAVTAKWAGKCESCGGWNTIVEEGVAPPLGSGATRRAKGRARVVCQINMSDANWAIAELDRVLKMGARGVLMGCAQPPAGVSTANTVWDPFWARLEEAGVPALLHIGSGGVMTTEASDPMLPSRGFANAESLRRGFEGRPGGERKRHERRADGRQQGHAREKSHRPGSLDEGETLQRQPLQVEPPCHQDGGDQQHDAGGDELQQKGAIRAPGGFGHAARCPRVFAPVKGGGCDCHAPIHGFLALASPGFASASGGPRAGKGFPTPRQPLAWRAAA